MTFADGQAKNGAEDGIECRQGLMRQKRESNQNGDLTGSKIAKTLSQQSGTILGAP